MKKILVDVIILGLIVIVGNLEIVFGCSGVDCSIFGSSKKDNTGILYTQKVLAAEHPAEHPVTTEKEHSAEHPAKETKEHPKEHPAKEKTAISTEELAKSIEEYVEQDAKLKGGHFLVYDPKNNEPLTLKLVLVHKDKLSKVEQNTYFACADFQTPKGKQYDLDFFMKGTKKQKIKVTEITIHKEEGNPRYTWYEEKGIWKKK